MKNIEEKLVGLLSKGHCTPKISGLAKSLREPSTTIHYNIKKLEKEGKVLAYKAVFDYRKIGRGFCTYVLITLSPDEYGNPERVARELVKFSEIESIDIITGDWELVLKVRTKDADGYYGFVRTVLSRKGVTKIKSLTSLKQVKTEFVALD